MPGLKLAMNKVVQDSDWLSKTTVVEGVTSTAMPQGAPVVRGASAGLYAMAGDSVKPIGFADPLLFLYVIEPTDDIPADKGVQVLSGPTHFRGLVINTDVGNQTYLEGQLMCSAGDGKYRAADLSEMGDVASVCAMLRIDMALLAADAEAYAHLKFIE